MTSMISAWVPRGTFAGRRRTELPPQRGNAGDGQRGMVTAEIAFASMGAALAAVALAWALAVLALLVRCQDTAAEVARQEARADRSAVAAAVADRPEGARVVVSQHGQEVRVTVRLDAQPWASWLPSIPVQASASVIREPA